MKKWFAFAVLTLGSLAGAGCKQALGERCQVDADCQDDLVCNQAQQVCATSGTSGGIDAPLPPLQTDAGDSPG